MSETDTQIIIEKLQQMQRDTEEQIAGVRREMHDMGAKFDKAIGSHYEMKTEFSVSMERMKASVDLIDKNQNELWDIVRKQQTDLALLQKDISNHIVAAEVQRSGQKNAGEWFKWVTPLVVTIMGIYISIRMTI